jgi:hypothetical protein
MDDDDDDGGVCSCVSLLQLKFGSFASFTF